MSDTEKVVDKYGNLWIMFRATDVAAQEYINSLLEKGVDVYAQAVGTPPNPPPNPPK